MRLRLSPSDARKLIETIPHKSCRKAISQHWRVTDGGEAAAQSVFWLFCWAKTGMNKPEAAEVARQVFDRIFLVPFPDFDARVPHEIARALRYASGDIQSELDALLAGS